MAQIFYTTLPVLASGSQENVGLQTLMHSTLTIYKYDEVQDNSIIVDEGDVFQCGKCKDKFSFAEFVIHKKNTCLGPRNDLINPSISGSYHVENLKPNELDGNRAFLIDPSQYPLETDALDVALSGPSKSFAEQNECSSDALPSSSLDGLKNFDIADNDSSFENSVLPEHFLLEEPKPFLPLSTGEIPPLGDFDLKNDSYLNSLKDALDASVEGPTAKENEKRTPKTGRLKCTFCEKEFKKHFDLKQHLRSHTGERPFLCVVCGRAFTQKSNVIKHMSTHKVWPKKNATIPENPFQAVRVEEDDSDGLLISADVSSFKCQYCSAVFPTHLEWRSHLKVHKNEKVFQCIQKSCDLTFPEVDDFVNHIRHHHLNDAQYHCHVCYESFSSLDKMASHKCTNYNNNNNNNTKTPEKVACSNCGAKYTRGKKHVCNNFSCPMCNRSFHCERFLRRHLPVHNSVAGHVCTECNKAFRTAKSLTNHKVVHSNLKPFSCRLCSATFSRREKLARHSLIHENLKKFKCPFSVSLGCPREFQRKDKLKKHLRVHETNKKNQISPLSSESTKRVNPSTSNFPLPPVAIQEQNSREELEPLASKLHAM